MVYNLWYVHKCVMDSEQLISQVHNFLLLLCLLSFFCALQF